MINSKNLTIRPITLDDAPAMCNYLNVLSKEQTFITWQGEEMTLEEETEFVKDEVQKMAEQKNVMLLAFFDNELIGISSIHTKVRVSRHEGVFGISVAQKYRGKGYGKLLMEAVLTEAKKNILELEIITLEVFGKNVIAQKMYKEFGFQEYGRLPNGFKYKGGYVDAILMHKKVE